MMVGAKYHLTALVVNLLVALTLASTVVKQSQFFDTGLSNHLFANHVLFNSRARSRLDCGHQCREERGCLSFTHVRGGSAAGSCRGYSAVPTSATKSATTVVGAKTYRVKVRNEGECQREGERGEREGERERERGRSERERGRERETN